MWFSNHLSATKEEEKERERSILFYTDGGNIFAPDHPTFARSAKVT